MASAERHHPEWSRFVLLVDRTHSPAGHAPGDARQDAPSASGEAFTAIPLDALSLPDARRFCFRYSILELNTAAKPWMFAYLFARGYDRVVYLDPDIVIYSPLAELDAGPPGTFLTLTPHLTGSIKGDEHPSERTIGMAGAYNLGFLAVSRQPQLERFLAWWQEKLEYQCVVDPARGLFVDQKWIDLVPGLFPGIRILRHDGYNVAYWNLGQRTVAAGAATGPLPDVPTVNGQPLRFFHFSGYDPAAPQMVSRHHHALRLADAGDARQLIEDYSASLRTAGYESFRDAPYAFGTFTDGRPIPEMARIAYRESPELQAAAGADPFKCPELFLAYRDAARRPPLTARAALSSYRLLSRARPLVRLIPPRLRKAMREFLLGRKEPAAPVARGAPHLLPGLDIVGYVTRDTGVGESARLCRNSCEAAALPSHVVDIDRTGGAVQRTVHRVSVHHVNADQVPVVREEFPQLFASGSYNIGCWHWELPELPDAWVGSAAPLDEIWAPSAFIQSAISRKVTIPVVHMPHGIEVTAIEGCSPQELGVPPGRFTFLCMFDLGSVVARKNPLGAVEAFRRAFPQGSEVALLIKAGHAANHAADYAELAARLEGIPNVYLSNRMLSRKRVNGLIASCDGIVSLHRSEGFGLILAEAMYLGKPVVATGWSGNMDFMNTANSCPVGYELVTLGRSYQDYQAGQHWAEPDVDHAAQMMRRVVDDAVWRKQLGDRARHTILSQFSPKAAGLRYRRRLAFLGLLDLPYSDPSDSASSSSIVAVSESSE